MNAFAAGADYAVRTGVELVLNPLLVGSLGSQLYGTWRVLWRWTGYVWATSGRSAQALQSAIANRQQEADHDEKRALVASALIVWLLFLPLLLLVGGLGVWAAPHLLDTSSEHVATVRLAAMFLVVDAIAVTVLTLPRSVLQGENLGYKRLGLSTVLLIVTAGLTVLALELDGGITGVAIANLAGTLFTGLLFWRVTRSHVPWFGLGRPSRSMVRWFLGLSWWFTVWKLVTQLMLAGDVVVLGIFGSVELVTVYTLSKYVPEALTTLVATLVNGVMPGLGGLIGSDDTARAARARAEMHSLAWLVATAVGVAVVVWNESFVGLWVGERFYSGQAATLAVVVMVLQLVLVRIDANIIDLTLDVRRKVLLGLGSTLFSLTIAAVAVGALDMGIVGLVVGVISGRLVLSVAYPAMVGRSFGTSFAAQLRVAIRPLATTAVLLAVGLVAGSHLHVDSWSELLTVGPLTGAAAALVAALGGLSAVQRARLVTRVRAIARPFGDISGRRDESTPAGVSRNGPKNDGTSNGGRR